MIDILAKIRITENFSIVVWKEEPFYRFGDKKDEYFLSLYKCGNMIEKKKIKKEDIKEFERAVNDWRLFGN